VKSALRPVYLAKFTSPSGDDARRIRWFLKVTLRKEPLAIGIGVEIVAKARDAGLKPYAVGTFLYHWTQSRRYLDALAAKDPVRWGLGGTAVDFVSREHQVAALVQLSALKTIRREAAR